MTTPLPAKTKPEGFADFLKKMDRGRFNDSLTEEMQDLVRQLHTLGEQGAKKPKGKIVVTILMTLDKKALFIDPEMKITAPKVVRGGTVMFPDGQGRLWPSDPDQMDAFPVESAAPQARSAQEVPRETHVEPGSRLAVL